MANRILSSPAFWILIVIFGGLFLMTLFGWWGLIGGFGSYLIIPWYLRRRKKSREWKSIP